MKKLLVLGVFLALAAIEFLNHRGSFLQNSEDFPRFAGSIEATDDVFGSAFAQQRSNLVAEGRGTVTRILSDDTNGSRHQRFIVALASGQTLLIAHNIDLAPRVEALSVGDTVSFKGEYEWNAKGGTVHWTHHDPAGHHEGGWIRLNGKSYE